MRVLILCTGNSCRSQMAEVIWQQLGGEDWQADSAGSRPSGYVHPLALKAIAEMGLPAAKKLRSKSVDEFAGQEFDLVVTVCDNAHEACPHFPGGKNQLHWPFEDPADAKGSEEEQLEFFREIRDLIHAKISSHLASNNS